MAKEDEQKNRSYLPERKTKKKNNYIDKAQLSANLVKYAEAKKDNPGIQVPDAIGRDIMRIAKGLALNSNFANYSFVDDMIMDGVEDCLKGVRTYDPLAQTRSGKPNPFGYFTQICYWAFVRRIKREAKHSKLRTKIIQNSTVLDFINEEEGDHSNVENIRDRHLSNMD